MQELTEKLRAVLQAAGIDVDIEWNTGSFVRNKSFYLSAQTFQINDTLVGRAMFGDWRKDGDIPKVWESYDSKFAFENSKEITAFLNTQEIEYKKAIQVRDADTAKEAESLWDSAEPFGEHPYLAAKKIETLFGAKIAQYKGHPLLLVPMYDIDATLWNVQRIFSKTFEHGNKFALAGRTRGLFFVLDNAAQKIADGDTLYLCEGYATGCAILNALGISETLNDDAEVKAPPNQVIVTFNASNMARVCGELSKKYPASRLIVCCDNDLWTKNSNGESWNPGFEAGRKCQKEYKAEVRIPNFKTLDTHPTDFNDLYVLEGLEAVKQSIENAPVLTPQKAKTPRVFTEDEAHKVSETKIVSELLEIFGDNIMAAKDDFFEFDSEAGIWKRQEMRVARKYIGRYIETLAHGKMKMKDISSTVQRFFMHVPEVPIGVNMFSPPPNVTNFLNGALELKSNADGTYSTHFRPHRKEDFLLYKHPYTYNLDAKPNTEFESAVKRILVDEEAISCYYEMLGCCLIPNFPKFFLFIGRPMTGKSTLIKFASYLVDPKLQSGVDLTEMRGFNTETLAGKLVNLCSEINTKRPIPDATLKLIEDRTPIRICRKGIADIYAPVPAIHIFGGNALPESRESREAYERRMIFFHCDKYKAPTLYDREFAERTFNLNPEGVLAVALRGLERVCKNRGHFTVADKSKEFFEAWKEEGKDVIEVFLDELREGDLKLPVTLDYRRKQTISNTVLWDAFKEWFEENEAKYGWPSSTRFGMRLKELGCTQTRHANGRMWYFPFTITPKSTDESSHIGINASHEIVDKDSEF